VVVANTRKVRAIAEAKVKTDKLDAATLCELLHAGFLPSVFSPDEWTRSLRRRLQRRSKLVRSRTRAKNELHAVLARNLKGRPPVSDVFGKAGREWLSALELAPDERETVEGCLRQVDFLDEEVGLIERELAGQALESEEIRRLMTVPGVSLISAATFVAVVGDVTRFATPKKLVSYVGLDPKVRQSGETPARHGRISKQGSSEARHMLCEAAWIVVRTPGPPRAFYERVRARRGAQMHWSQPRASSAWSSGICSRAKRTTPSVDLPSPAASCARSSSRSTRAGVEESTRVRASTRLRRTDSASTSLPSSRRSPIAGSSRTGSPSPRKRVRVRHGGAHLQVIFLAKRQQRGRPQPQDLRFSTSSPAPGVTVAERRSIV
jgi:transposase